MQVFFKDTDPIMIIINHFAKLFCKSDSQGEFTKKSCHNFTVAIYCANMLV